MKKVSLPVYVLLVSLCLLASVHYSMAQGPTASPTPQPAQAEGAEDDPTKPLAFSIRNEYRNLRNDAWANAVVFRWDTVAFRGLHNKGGLKGLILRFDIPLITAHVGSNTKTGLGDIYAQAIYVPKATRKFAFAVGTGAFIPTATSTILGTGKLVLAPTAVPIWNFPKSRRKFLIRFQNYFSVAGKSTRPDINYFVAGPALIGRLTGKWWYTADTELKWNWKTQKGSGLTGFLFGRLVNGKVGIAFKPEIGWGPGRASDFNLKFAVFKIR